MIHYKMQYFLFLLSVAPLLVSATNASRIIGGKNATDGQFPFAAAIQVETSFSRYFCGGAVIFDQWVLTSGHCVYTATHLTIQLGSVTLTMSDPNRVTVTSTEYFIHPAFDPTTFANDVALIKLRTSVTEHDSVESCTIYGGEVPSNTEMVTLGWGQTSDSETNLSEYLQYVEVTSLTDKDCKLIYGDKIPDSLFCAEGNVNEGTCLGDAGGPIFDVNGTCGLWGIASFISSTGCENTQPSGFTKVPDYIDWIIMTINEN